VAARTGGPATPRVATCFIEYAEARAALGAYLGLCLAHALDDLPYASPSELYSRFLGWVPGVDPETTRDQQPG
jgi:hypothetical protein